MTALGIEQRLLELLPSDSCHDFHPFLCWQAKAARPRVYRTFSDYVPHFLKKTGNPRMYIFADRWPFCFLHEYGGLFHFLFCLFISQKDEEYLVAWRVSQLQETLGKPGYRPCLICCEHEFSEV